MKFAGWYQMGSIAEAIPRLAPFYFGQHGFRCRFKALWGDAELAFGFEGSSRVPSILDNYSSVLESQPPKKKHQNLGSMLSPVRYEPRQRLFLGQSHHAGLATRQVPYCIALNGGSGY